MAEETNIRSRTVWINAGETSGDLHGALLIREMRRMAPEMEFMGMAGPAMRAEGCKAVAMTEELSVMGFTEVLAKLPRILGLLGRVRKGLAEVRPAAVVLVDAPDFNFRVAKMADRLDARVFYYVSPQVWAWRQGRVRFLKRHVDRMLLILPFEKPFYDAWHMPASYVGNPLADIVRRPETLAVEPLPGRIGLLPGSRRREVASLMPVFAEAARLLHRIDPSISFLLVRAPGIEESAIMNHWHQGVPLEMASSEDRYAAMRTCQLLMAASGTVTLESALLGVPTIVAYKFSALTFALGKLLVKVPFISLPNLILGREVFPELLQRAASGPALAGQAMGWLRHPEQLAAIRQDLDSLADLLGPTGAARRAAEIILEGLL